LCFRQPKPYQIGGYSFKLCEKYYTLSILFELLDIQPNDNVLDLGCGTGHITKLIRENTEGKVVGVDSSAGMIEKAKEKWANYNIVFLKCSAEELDYQNEFEIIFCNSTFQWFTNPGQALKTCYSSLRKGGKMAIQSPARDDYCPNFLKAIEEVKRAEATKDIFTEFKSPWFFRNTADEYKRLFEDAGFNVEKSTIDKVVTNHSADEAYRIFESGAAAGYLNQDYYRTRLTQEYTDIFRSIVRKSFNDQAGKTGQVELMFYRIYLLAIKE
jgi:ubiquinone/menaquinone biosynthesis C-methylase UbiE